VPLCPRGASPEGLLQLAVVFLGDAREEPDHLHADLELGWFDGIEAHTVTLAGCATGSGRLVLLVASPEMPAEQAERALSMASVPTAVLAGATVPAARTDGAGADSAGGERPGLDWRRPSAAPLWRGAGRNT
jgi:hypothetical protein